jgi:hypothetical protein
MLHVPPRYAALTVVPDSSHATQGDLGQCLVLVAIDPPMQG